MRFRSLLRLGLVLAAVLGLMLGVSAARVKPELAPPAQPTAFVTPTPGPDGTIIYIVQPLDTLWDIAALTAKPGQDINQRIQEIMAMNGILPEDFLTPGMQIVLGLGGPAVATSSVPTAEPAPTGPPVTPTPMFGTGEICVLLFVDTNGNARLDESELALPEGRVTVVNVAGQVAGEATTDETPEGRCFADLQNDEYNVSAAVPPGYNPTTSMSLPLRLAPGEIKYVEFGAQPSGTLGGPLSPEEQVRSTLLGILGVGLVLAAGGLGYYASRMNRRTPMSLR